MIETSAALADHNMDLVDKGQLMRRVEELDYWRKRAGWFDDDESMKEYNSGVYDAYYQTRDSNGGKFSLTSTGKNADAIKIILKVIIVLVALILLGLLLRAIARRMEEKGKTVDRKRSSSRSRSVGRSSSSRSRSGRSRSRSRADVGAGGYDLMDDDDGRSRKSNRSSSRSKSKGRSSSRSRERSRSKSRSTRKPSTSAASMVGTDDADPVLV
jgi:hypothetical protein